MSFRTSITQLNSNKQVAERPENGQKRNFYGLYLAHLLWAYSFALAAHSPPIAINLESSASRQLLYSINLASSSAVVPELQPVSKRRERIKAKNILLTVGNNTQSMVCKQSTPPCLISAYSY